MIKLSTIKVNPDNPRIIKDEKFRKLVNSIEEFPKMMKLRPIVVDGNNMVLGGNMRLKALQELKYKEIPDDWIKRADELTEDEKKRFIVADNVGFGEWEWDSLQADWNVEDLEAWGVDLPQWDLGHEANNMTDEDVDLEEEFKIIGAQSDKFKLGLLFENQFDCETYISKNKIDANKKGQIWTAVINSQSI
jgi:hypothetical protein